VITGTVNRHGEAVVPIVVRSFDAREMDVETILDTGFTGSLTLPTVAIERLGLSWVGRGLAILANGAEEQCDLYAAAVVWDGIPRRILIESAETEPLLGMALLRGHLVSIEVIDGGSVTIEALP
jgi:clan AA aspartic protease